MPIPYSCDCGYQGSAADEHAGRKGKCPGCGVILTVPTAPIAPQAGPASSQATPPMPPMPPSPAAPATAAPVATATHRPTAPARNLPKGPYITARGLLFAVAWVAGLQFFSTFVAEPTTEAWHRQRLLSEEYQASQTGSTRELVRLKEEIARNREDERTRRQTSAVCWVVALAGIACSRRPAP